MKKRQEIVYSAESQGYQKNSRPSDHPSIVIANLKGKHLSTIRCNQIYKGQSYFINPHHEQLYRRTRSQCSKSQIDKSEGSTVFPQDETNHPSSARVIRTHRRSLTSDMHQSQLQIIRTPQRKGEKQDLLSQTCRVGKWHNELADEKKNLQLSSRNKFGTNLHEKINQELFKKMQPDEGKDNEWALFDPSSLPDYMPTGYKKEQANWHQQKKNKIVVKLEKSHQKQMTIQQKIQARIKKLQEEVKRQNQVIVTGNGKIKQLEKQLTDKKDSMKKLQRKEGQNINLLIYFLLFLFFVSRFRYDRL